MDVNTNHLVADLSKLKEEERIRYSQIPANLLEDARQELGGQPDVYVNPNSETALSKWAAKKRKQQRGRNKIAKASRARNRAK